MFDETDNQVFSLKKKITCWLKNAEEVNMLKSLSTISRSSASKTSKGSKASKNQDLLEYENHPKRRSLKIKSG